MRTTYRPDEVAAWTNDDFQQLVGKYVDVTVPASEEYRNAPGGGGDWEGGSGICVSAERAEFRGTASGIVNWDWSQSWYWPAHEGAWVSVCDEHGDHTSLNGVDCLDQLGPAAKYPDTKATA